MRSALALAVLVIAGCDAGSPTSVGPPPAPTIDCFGTACSSTCCFVGDAALCTADANDCISCMPVDLSDGGDDADDGGACLDTTAIFGCFSTADCPDTPPDPGSFEGPYACCFTSFFGVATACTRVGLFGCGLFSTPVCTSDADCATGHGTCKPIVVGGHALAVRACQ